MGFWETTKIVLMKEDEKARDYARRLQRLLDQTPGPELEQELDWIAERIAVGQEIKKELEKTELDGVMLKEVALHYSGGAVTLDSYLILPKVNVLVTYGESDLKKALERSRAQMQAMQELRLRKAGWLRRWSMKLYFQEFFKPLAVVDNEVEIPKEHEGLVVSVDQLSDRLKELNRKSSARSLPRKELEKEAQRILNAGLENAAYYEARFREIMSSFEGREGR